MLHWFSNLLNKQQQQEPEVPESPTWEEIFAGVSTAPGTEAQ